MSVIIGGKTYNVEKKKGLLTLDLSKKKLSRIGEVEGLDKLTDLESLDLSKNKITKIEGLENLTNLKELNLSKNKITKFEGLEKLTELERLRIFSLTYQFTELEGFQNLNNLNYLKISNGGKLYKWMRDGNAGGIDMGGVCLDPQAVVNYCKEKAGETQAQLEAQKIESPEFRAEIKEETKEFLIKAPNMYEQLTFQQIMNRTTIRQEELQLLLEELILDGDIKGKIQGNIISFEQGEAIEEPVETTLSPFIGSDVHVYRGGDWKVEGDQSVFYYKVKVKNESAMVITNIQILLTSIPSGLETDRDRYQIVTLKPNALESPTFRLKATQSCVGDTVEGIVTYTDPTGQLQTAPIEPFEICYVCNLLSPKPVSREEFDEKVEFMEEKKMIISSDLDLSALESKIFDIVSNCNFAVLQNIEELKANTNSGFSKIEGMAQGLYDKSDVALSVAVKQMEHGSSLVVKAMSDKGDKVNDLLRELSSKMDDIKSDTELIKEYTSQIEDVLDKTEDIEDLLLKRLGTDFDKIKHAWVDYKDGKIGKGGLVKAGITLIGKKFVKSMLHV